MSPNTCNSRLRPAPVDITDRGGLLAAEKVRIQYWSVPTAFIGRAVMFSLMGFARLTGACLEKAIGWMSVVYIWVTTRYIQWRAFNGKSTRRHFAPRVWQHPRVG